MDFNNIMIGTDDAARLVEYYTRLFGAPQMDDGGFSGWQIGSGWLTVGPHSEVHGKSAQPGRIIWNIESSDVRADFDRLAAAGRGVHGGDQLQRQPRVGQRDRQLAAVP